MSENEQTLYENLVDVDRLTKGVGNVYTGRSSAWRKFFQSWAVRVLGQDYFKALIDSRLSYCAYLSLKNNPLDSRIVDANGRLVKEGTFDRDFDLFLKGYAAGVRTLYLDVKSASTQISKLEDNNEE